ncbi:MAG TPA: hypothetical protein VMT86_22700 [Bryobacteraceae bacterium]|nr:hypothetical protein [Bryobacteraceae bacterium]
MTEQLGEILLQCSGKPGAAVNASVSVLLPTTITNRVNASGFSTGATLSINTGAGPVASGVAGLVTNQSIAFNGFTFTIPANGTFQITVDDIRADVNQLGLQPQTRIQAILSSSLALSGNPVIVGITQQGLLATSMDSGVTCTGSAAPSTVSLTNLFANGTAEQTTRLTEGFAAAFVAKDPTSDTGTRFMLTYSNFPAGANIYVPDAVAGTDAALPSAGGDLGTAAAVGQYKPNSQTLLLVRVLNADATGEGGALATLPAPNGSGVLVLDGANPVTLTNGAGYAVYEVADSNPSVVESVQIPNFFSIAPNSPPSSANGSVSLAPVSTISSASATAPIPRFVAVTPPSDCGVIGDCGASYYPVLQVNSQPMQASAVAGGKRVGLGNLTIKNTGGGVLGWSANITYNNGSNWILLTQSTGINGGTVQVVADPSSLAPGTYTATLTIDAGSVAGNQTIPTTLTVTPALTAPAVVINAITDAADFRAAPVVAGELATIWGTNLAGQTVSVTFNGVQANLLYTGAQQINLRIPPSLAGAPSAQAVVTADGNSSAPYTVQLAAVAPAVFNPGVLNQDNTVNSAAAPAALGTVLQIFGTGMPDSGGSVTVTIQNTSGLVPIYAGAAPGLPGIEQVNVAIPANASPGSASLIVCAMGSGNQQYCSQPVPISLK